MIVGDQPDGCLFVKHFSSLPETFSAAWFLIVLSAVTMIRFLYLLWSM